VFGVPSRDAVQLAVALPVTIVATLAIGASEELLFRGLPFQLVVEGLGAAGGTLVLAGLFGLAHLGAGGSLAGVAGTAGWGVLLCVARLRTGSLWFPIGFHWAGNLVEGVVWVPTSGQRWSHPLLTYASRGDPRFTGAEFGPEAGLFSAAVVAAALAVTWGVASLRDRRVGV
jgi:hypothetical protein